MWHLMTCLQVRTQKLPKAALKPDFRRSGANPLRVRTQKLPKAALKPRYSPFHHSSTCVRTQKLPKAALKLGVAIVA